MGDYVKLIVSCKVKKEITNEIDKRVEDLGLCVSAYQSPERVFSLAVNEHRKEELNFILIGQTKYGQGQEEFCEWLRSYVVQGSGLNDVFALSFSEYSDEPTLYKLTGFEEF